jgi:glycosyltransferase involved in cell wall biosynthesis
MKVLFDHSAFRWDFGGVSKYFCEVIRRMPKDSWELSVKYSNNEYLKDYGIQKCLAYRPEVKNKYKSLIINSKNKSISINALKKGDYTIYHQTHYDNFGIKYVKENVPVVTTMYDMNFFAIPQYYSKLQLLHFCGAQKNVAQSADSIISISENTKKDLIKFFNIPENKITVIHLGVDTLPAGILYKDLINQPYILYVGQRHSYKNFKNAAAAFAKIKNNFDICLVCTGPELTNKENEYLESLGIKDSVKYVRASEDEMNSLYHFSKCFIFPSFYEGFGLPLLEAMVNGAPVMCANASCFPEIAGDAAVYFDPANAAEIADKMTSLLESSDLRNKYAALGMERVKLFSWDSCTKKHIELYNRLS